MRTSVDAVEAYLTGLQDRICSALTEIDGRNFIEDVWQHKNSKGGGRSRVLEHGEVIEKGGVLYSHIHGDDLPPAATLKRPDLAGKKFEALGLSLVIHPRNPHAPTSHMNVRFFVAGADTEQPVWWFGGGFDLTPYYGYSEDAKHWHQIASVACAEIGQERYCEYKKWCDDYFYLPHRQEARGIGGLFFDDLNEGGFKTCFDFMQSVGDHYLPAYLPILERRKDIAYTQAQRDWQLLRRGRYVEFNLVYDRGTLFGLQSGGRTESILMSLPPLVSWAYQVEPAAGTPESELLKEFLIARDWL